MTNMVKMDLYRFFRSTSTWISLLTAVILAFLMVMLVHTTINTTAASVRISNAGELLTVQINSGVPMALCAVAVIIFVSAKYKNGFIKNIANQLSRHELLVVPEIIVTFAACALYFFAYSICTIAAGKLFFGNTFITFPFFAIMKLLIVQFILHWSFCCLLLLIYMLTNSTAFTMAAGLLITFKILNVFYALVEQFTSFNIEQYMLDANIFQLGMESAAVAYIRATIVGLIFLLAEIALLYIVMYKKDI